MTTGLVRLQGRIFSAVALTLVVACLAGARLAPLQQVLAMAALVSLLGMPHGALDTVFARRLFGVTDPVGWTLFTLAYVGLAGAVVGVWFVAPTLFLVAFLVASALHFGGDRVASESRPIGRALYGGAVIVLPALWHGDELQRLLGWVAGPESAAVVAPVLRGMAGPWLVLTGLACLMQARAAPAAAVEWLALAALALAAPPLVAFTVYFCVMHSPRHVIRTLGSLEAREARSAVLMAGGATLAACGGLAVLLARFGDDRPLQVGLTQVVFVGLAALTLPHMVLLEQARRQGLRPAG